MVTPPPGRVVGSLAHLHPLDRQEGRQVGSVGGDHDEGEEPPHTGHHAGGDGPAAVQTLFTRMKKMSRTKKGRTEAVGQK